MKNKRGIIGVVILLIVIVGCAQPAVKRRPDLAEQYTAKAAEYEARGDLIEALEQYRLAVTVDPENQLAQEKSVEIEQELNERAEKHYEAGLEFHQKGQYGEARKEFLMALRCNPDHAEAKDMLTSASKEIEQVRRFIPHIIQPGETISTLADRYYGDYRKFHLIAEYNELEDATKVTVGEEIKIPVLEGMPIMAAPGEIQTETGEAPESMPGEIITVKSYVTHTVQPGESLSKLAQMYYGDYKKFDLIVKFNGLEDATSVQFGQQIRIPEVDGFPFLAEGKARETIQAEPPESLVKVEKTPSEKKAVVEEQPTVEDQLANYRELGIELFENKQYAEAISEFDKVLNANPKDAVTREYLAKSHFQQGLVLFNKEDYLAARGEFETTLDYDTTCDKCEENIKKCEEMYKNAHYDKGLSHFENEELADAIREWELVDALDPTYKDVDKNLKKARTLQERLEKIKRSKKKDSQE